MFEWRIFKKLPLKKYSDFEGLLGNWKKGTKY